MRRYAAATNLLIASRRFAVVGPIDDHLRALIRMLTDMGAQCAVIDPEATVAEDEFHAVFQRSLDLATGARHSTVVVLAAADGRAKVTGADGHELVPPPGSAGATSHPHAPDPDYGERRIEWARRHMPVTAALTEALVTSRAVRGVRIGLSLVLEPKTAVLALALARAGAVVSVFGHPAETRDDVAQTLRKQGLAVFANSQAGADEAAALADAYLRRGHDLLIDDGSHLIRRAHELPDALIQLKGAAEETTSGLRPLRRWLADGRLKIPVVAVNDARSKTLFDNAYGTGQSCLLAILDLLDPGHRGVDLTGGTVLVLGYGDVGKGFARHAAAMGACVTIAEIDPVRALQARFDGYEVGDPLALARDAMLIVSATGERDTITVEIMRAARAGAALAVAGGVDQEISLDEADSGAIRVPAGFRREALTWPDGHSVTVLDKGDCINVTAGEGNPIEIMDLSFGAQLAAIQTLVSPDAPGEPGLYALSKQADDDIAAAALAAGSGATGDGAHPDDRVGSASERVEIEGEPGDRTPSSERSGADRAASAAGHPLQDGGRAARERSSSSTWEAKVAERSTALAREYGVRLGTQESNPSLVQVYSAGLVIPVTAPAVIGGAVAVRAGRIEHVGERDWVIKTLREGGQAFTERHWPGVLMPGLVNAHTHLQYTGMVEVAGRTYSGFDDWAEAFNAVYDHREHDWRRHAADGAQQAIRHGTTAAADVVTDPEAASALHDAGLHGVAYWEVMGWTNEDWAKYGLTQTADELDRMPTPPYAGLSPHAPYSLDTLPLLEIPDLVRRRGLRLHIHLAESQLEAQWAEQSSGSLAELWRSGESKSFRVLRDSGFGMSATEFVDQLGVLGPDCHVAHGVYMTAWDRSLWRARATAVALCPRSNQIIGLDAPPVAAYLSEGNLIAVGTDSLSSSPSLDLLADVALLYELARAQGYDRDDLARRLLYAATLGGATALGLSAGPDRVGQLQTGAVADMVFLDIPVSDIFGTIEDLVRYGDGSVVATMISGKIKWKDAIFNRGSR